MKAQTYQAAAPVPLEEPRPRTEQEAWSQREAPWDASGRARPRLQAQRGLSRSAAGKPRRQQREAGAEQAARPAQPEAPGADGPVGPAASQGLSGRRSPTTLPGEGEIGTGPPRWGDKTAGNRLIPPRGRGRRSPTAVPPEGGGNCPHAAGEAAAPSRGRSRRPPRPVPGGRARDSPAPGAPLRAAGPLTATALPLGELPACHSSPHAYWCSVSAASSAPPCRARRAGIPNAPPPAGPRRAQPPGSHSLQPPLVFPRRADDWLRAVAARPPQPGTLRRVGVVLPLPRRARPGVGPGAFEQWPAWKERGREGETGEVRTCGITAHKPPVWPPGL